VGSTQVNIRSPHDLEAGKWLDRYEEYLSFAADKPVMARIATWVYEWHVWVMVVATAGLILLPSGMFIPAAMLAAVYWYWICTSVPRVKKKYDKLRKDGRILRVPSPLLELFAKEMRKLDEDGGSFSDADLQLRFVVLYAVMRDHATLAQLIADDCGCREPCFHAGRLKADRAEGAVTRGGVHRRMRTNIARAIAMQAGAAKPEPGQGA
jgi:hypothetical protein